LTGCGIAEIILLPIVGGIKYVVGVLITPNKIRWTAWKNLPIILRGLTVRRGRVGG
jgi:hypothetical protein